MSTRPNKIIQVRGGRGKEREEVLAYNDALHVLRVYAKRREAKPNPYGYRTWWLTQETLVRRATGEVVAKHHSLYMMRPEFILNFISIATTLAPSKPISATGRSCPRSATRP
jgi:hypothetical protein